MAAMLRPCILLIALAVSACDSAPPPAHAATRKERRQDAEAVVSKKPEPFVYSYTEGELRVYDVPTLAPGSALVESQKCFVWRDREFRTSTISCPQPPEVVLSRD